MESVLLQKDCVYHLLCRAFRKGITVAEIIDLDIFHVVAVVDIDLPPNVAARIRFVWMAGCWWSILALGGRLAVSAECLKDVAVDSYCANGGYIDVLDALLGLD